MTNRKVPDIEGDMIETLDVIYREFGRKKVAALCDQVNTEHNSLLHLAVRRSMRNLVSYIYSNRFKKLDDNVTHARETALHIAAKAGDVEMIEQLIKLGADLSAQDVDGHTPLHDCLQQVHFEGGYENEAKCEKIHQSLEQDCREICNLVVWKNEHM